MQFRPKQKAEVILLSENWLVMDLGRKLHEQPEVPNWGKKGTGPKMEKGLVICIEPMINAGKKETLQMRDGWTIKTADGKPSAHFEYAVAVDKGKADVLTTFEFIEKVLNKYVIVWLNNHQLSRTVLSSKPFQMQCSGWNSKTDM